jgi:hypothetical protein
VGEEAVRLRRKRVDNTIPVEFGISDAPEGLTPSIVMAICPMQGFRYARGVRPDGSKWIGWVPAASARPFL